MYGGDDYEGGYIDLRKLPDIVRLTAHLLFVTEIRP